MNSFNWSFLWADNDSQGFNYWFNHEFEGGVSGDIEDDFVLPTGLVTQNTNPECYVTVGNGTLEFDSLNTDSRASLMYQVQSNNTGELALTVGNRYEVHVIGHRIGTEPSDGGDVGVLRLINFNNASDVDFPENGYSLTDVVADTEIEFDAMAYFDVLTADYELDIRFGHGVWNVNNQVLSIDRVAIYDMGPAPILRKLLDSEGEVLTDEFGTPLQHDLETEEDMLFTDYWPCVSVSEVPGTITGTPEQVATVTMNAVRGLYEITASVSGEFSSGAGSAQLSFTGSASSPEFTMSPDSDQDDAPMVWDFSFPLSLGDGEFTLNMLASESDSGSVELFTANMTIKRIGNYVEPD